APDTLFELLPRAHQERLALELLSENKAWKDFVILRCAINCIQPHWSEAFSRALIELFGQHSAFYAAGWTAWWWREILRLGCRLHPATLAATRAEFEKLAAISQVELLLNLLQFRHDMLQELHQ